MNGINAHAIFDGLRLRHLGQKISCPDTVDSTNEQAWRDAVQGAPSGTIVLADRQTQGRGRQGRTWFAPPGASLLFSALLRLDIPLERLPLITAVSALAAAHGLEELSGHPIRIRFPNDLIADGKKLGGILVESRLISNRLDFVIVGMGINVRIEPEEFPEDLRTTATSLAMLTKKKWSREDVARTILGNLDTWVATLLDSDLATIRRAWSAYSSVLGKRVRIEEGGKSFSGTVDEMDPLDGIILRTDNGTIRGFRGEHIQKLTAL